MRNVLGFLLAGFGAILSFLGIRSSEITTVLRNDSLQASLIALILLFGVLTAVSAIASDSRRQIYFRSVLAIGAVLFGVGALVIFAIPIAANLFTVSGAISLVIGCGLVLGGMVALVHYRPFWADEGVSDERGSGTAAEARSVGRSVGKWPVDIIDILILASVVLTATAAYGAMRLESRSQLSFSAQVAASFSIDGPLATVSMHVAATKIGQ
ncbi:MAG: hypothetical protein ACLQFR_07915 [Streptosporangiaceae bacterium]